MRLKTRLERLEMRRGITQRFVCLAIAPVGPGTPETVEEQLATEELRLGVELPEPHRQHVLSQDYTPDPSWGLRVFFLDLNKPPEE